MAIGSDPEIGTQFGQWKDMNDKQQRAWFQHMKEYWGPDLMGGYGKVIYVDEQARRTHASVVQMSDLQDHGRADQ